MGGAGDPGSSVPPFPDAIPDSTDPSRDPTHRSQATSQSGERAEGSEVTSLPLVVDTVINTKWKDGEYHLARVVSTRKPRHATDEKDTEYYMHFINMNRRMDTWCNIGMMDLSWHVYDGIDEKRCDSLQLHRLRPHSGLRTPSTRSTCSRNQKRKYEDDHGAEHGNFDMTEIREHEEFTKVKNIERIELGRYEMETWYFSPFPEEFTECIVRPTVLLSTLCPLWRMGTLHLRSFPLLSLYTADGCGCA